MANTRLLEPIKR